MTPRVDKGTLREALRADILAGRFLPRERLIEADLVAQYGQPRSAVRAALAELVSDGLVEHERNRGARVRQVSIDEAVMVLQVRQRLQALCTELAAVNGTAEEKAQLPNLLEDLQRAVDHNNANELFDANLAIRQHIRAMARQEIATQVLEQLEARNVLRFFPHAIQSRRHESYLEQVVVIEAVMHGDSVKARDVETARMQHAIEALRTLADNSVDTSVHVDSLLTS
jgi:DNA-binding GntR family transcriptional regulator